MVCGSLVTLIQISIKLERPVILHPKYSLLGIGGIKGSVTLVSTIQYQCGIDFGLEKKNRNSSIVPYSKVIDYSQKTPFLVSNLEMEGKAYAGALLDFTAQYDENSQKLKGIFDFYFYDDPSQRRQDGFTVSLASGDSGYVSCSKVINNGGCAAALRIFSSNSRSAKNADYSRAVGDEGCNVGFYNANY